jgi:hypothetical protein
VPKSEEKVAGLIEEVFVVFTSKKLMKNQQNQRVLRKWNKTVDEIHANLVDLDEPVNRIQLLEF